MTRAILWSLTDQRSGSSHYFVFRLCLNDESACHAINSLLPGTESQGPQATSGWDPHNKDSLWWWRAKMFSQESCFPLQKAVSSFEWGGSGAEPSAPTELAVTWVEDCNIASSKGLALIATLPSLPEVQSSHQIPGSHKQSDSALLRELCAWVPSWGCNCQQMKCHSCSALLLAQIGLQKWHQAFDH